MLVALGATAVLSAAVGFVPQFGGPGYEVALAAGLVLPSVAALSAAADLARFEPEPLDAYCRGVANGVALFAVLCVVTLAHGLRVGLCDVLNGMENLALGPGIGLALAGAWGAVAAELGRGRKRRHAVLRSVIALAAPIGSIGVGVARFYTSPMIFGYDPFVGYFSGTLYDTVIDLDGLLTYRCGSVATLFAGFVAALHLTHGARGKVVFQSIGRPGLLTLGILSAATSMGISLAGPDLDHWHTRATIAEDLGSAIEGERCRVVHARAIAPDRAQRFARECEGHVVQVERWLGVRGPATVTVFLFESAAQKQRMMGAAGTNIAKPWRAEVYVQDASYPHRVLGHEIAHVIAAGAARGPFEIAGSVGGWLPNPGLIEGLAVAASPRDEDLSPMDWAKAMKDLDLLPNLESLFTLSFLGESSALAYTVSGAFVGWVRDTYGGEVVVAWYGGADLREATGKSWSELQAAWHAELDAIKLPEAARVQAAAKFDKPGFFKRRCPRTVDGCRERAGTLGEAGDTVGAMAELERALELEPAHVALQIDKAELLLLSSKVEEGEAALRRLADDESVARHHRDRALRAIGDLAFARGDTEVARKAFEEVLSRTVDANGKRALAVKLAATKDAALRPALVALLVGVVGKRPDKLAATELLGALDRERPGDGLPAYLLARGRIDADDYEAAAERLDRALARKIDVPFVRAEALRLRVVTACALGDGAGARRWLEEYGRDPDVSDARYGTSLRLVSRCAGVEEAALPKRAGGQGAR